MSKRSLNQSRAVSSHTANQGLVGWWLALPGRIGGPKYWDLVNGNHAVLRNYTPGSTGSQIVAGAGGLGNLLGDGNGNSGADAIINNGPLISTTSALTVAIYLEIKTASQGSYTTPLCVVNSGNSGAGIAMAYMGPLSIIGGTTITGAVNLQITPGKYHYAYTRSSTQSQIYVNGSLKVTGGTGGDNVVANKIAFGRYTYNSGLAPAAGDVFGDVRFASRTVSAAELAFWYQERLKGYPNLLAYRSFVSFAKPSSGGTGITGTAATTAGTTTTSTATVAIAGTGSTTAGTTSSGAGVGTVVGTAATTAGTTSSGTGTVTITGTVSTSAGTVTAGTVATIVGATAATTAGTTSSGTGTVTIAGVGVTTADTTTLASGNTTGTISPISGTGSTTAGTTTTGTGTVKITGTGSTSATTNTVTGGVVRITSTGTTNAGTVTTSTGTTTGGSGGPTVDNNVYVFLLGA